LAGLENASLGTLLKTVTVVGGGWAGLAAAVLATQLGFRVRLLEAAPQLGGRARRVLHDGLALDNGQHILIGAYTSTLGLMKTLGVNTDQCFHRQTLDLRFLDGQGLRLPQLPAPLNVLLGVATAKGWSWRDRWAFLRRAQVWQNAGFVCDASTTVGQLCQGLPAPVMQQLIEPLCVSALNLTSEHASGKVFLRVLKDALLSGAGSSDTLIPRTDLSQLLPDAALSWLQSHGAEVVLGERVSKLPEGQVLLACPAWQAAELAQSVAPSWALQAQSLQHTAIATVYARSTTPFIWPSPMLALRHDHQSPAQFAFDKGRLVGTPDMQGLVAMVVSDCTLERDAVTAKVLQQAQQQLGLSLTWLTTVVEKRATFACTPGLQRPAMQVAKGVWACGDHVGGPYPATLEGAVRSGYAAAQALMS
jgi:predicted NAD/FAD-dependent oxidoreductase